MKIHLWNLKWPLRSNLVLCIKNVCLYNVIIHTIYKVIQSFDKIKFYQNWFINECVRKNFFKFPERQMTLCHLQLPLRSYLLKQYTYIIYVHTLRYFCLLCALSYKMPPGKIQIGPSYKRANISLLHFTSTTYISQKNTSLRVSFWEFKKMSFRKFKKILSNTFIYQICMNTNIMNTLIFYLISMTWKVICLSGNLRKFFITHFLIDFDKHFKNTNIMNTQIFHFNKYDLKGNKRSLFNPWFTVLWTTFVLTHVSRM